MKDIAFSERCRRASCDRFANQIASFPVYPHYGPRDSLCPRACYTMEPLAGINSF